MKDELKSCPFCGGRAELISKYDRFATSTYYKSGYNKAGVHHVECKRCGIKTESYTWFKILPVEDWNERIASTGEVKETPGPDEFTRDAIQKDIDKANKGSKDLFDK